MIIPRGVTIILFMLNTNMERLLICIWSQDKKIYITHILAETIIESLVTIVNIGV